MGKVEKKEIIAIDQDWVLAKLLHKWLIIYNLMYKDNLTVEDIKSWDVSEYVKPEAKKFIYNVIKLPKFCRDLEVVADSQRVVKKLSEKYEIVILTDPSSRYTLVDKYDWLEEMFPFIPAKNYIFAGNKSIIKADYLIDDGVHNFEGFTGIPILYDAPYNREETRFYRALNWQDIEHIFENKLPEVKAFYKAA